MSYILNFLRWLWNPGLVRTHRFDVALSTLQQIRSSVDIEKYDFEDRDVARTQLQELGDFIEHNHLLDDSISRQPGRSAIAVAQLVGSPSSVTDRASFLAILDQIKSLLEVKRTISVNMRGPETFSGAQAKTPARTSAQAKTSTQATTLATEKQDSASTEPQKPSNPDELAPDQIAFLWQSTEKLYGSWPFRLLGALMIAAVFLAGAGTFFIGGQTLQLRQNLENTAHDQTGQLEKIGEQTRRVLNEQSENLKGEADRRKDDIKQRMEKVDQQIGVLEGKSDELLKQAVDLVAAKMEKNLQPVENALREKITSDLTGIKNDDVGPLQREVKELRSNVQQLTRDVGSDSEALKKSHDGLQIIARIAPEAEKLDEKVTAIRKADTDAKAALQSAQTASSQIDGMQKEVSGKFKPISDEINTHQHALGAVQTQLGALAAQISEAKLNSDRTKQILDDAKRANEMLESLKNASDDLQKRIAKLEARLPENQPKPVVPSPPKFTEEDLTRNQWRKIQQALADMKYSPGTIDGQPGGRTRQAIKAFQAKSAAPSTGNLTPEQIETLLRSP